MERNKAGLFFYAAASAAYLIGILWRCHYIFVLHPAVNFVYSDMAGYLHSAYNYLDPGYIQSIGDAVLPPGAAYYFALLGLCDPSWGLAAVVQCFLSVLVPFFIAAIADELFNRRVALAALILASLHFPFIDYASYFLSEGPVLFFLVFGTWLLVRTLRCRRGWAVLLTGMISGLSFGIASSFKMVALPSVFLMVLVVVIFAVKSRWGKVIWALAGGTMGLLIILTPLSIRATVLNEGKLCVIANQFGYNFLLGHHGQPGLLTWSDAKRGMTIVFGSPSAGELAYQGNLEVPFGAYDNKENVEYALKWIREHPIEALRLSIENIFNLFLPSGGWPTGHSSTPQRYWIRFAQEVYGVFILLPACIFLWENRRFILRWERIALGDLLVLMPLIALCAAVFFGTGEPRYRIPFDGFMILLAARFYAGGSATAQEKLLLP